MAVKFDVAHNHLPPIVEKFLELSFKVSIFIYDVRYEKIMKSKT